MCTNITRLCCTLSRFSSAVPTAIIGVRDRGASFVVATMAADASAGVGGVGDVSSPKSACAMLRKGLPAVLVVGGGTGRGNVLK